MPPPVTQILAALGPRPLEWTTWFGYWLPLYVAILLVVGVWILERVKFFPAYFVLGSFGSLLGWTAASCLVAPVYYWKVFGLFYAMPYAIFPIFLAFGYALIICRRPLSRGRAWLALIAISLWVFLLLAFCVAAYLG